MAEEQKRAAGSPEADEAAETAASPAERELARRLAEGEADGRNAAEEAVASLPPRWEIRIRSESDPIAEKTAVYRKMASEADDRYARYDGTAAGGDASAKEE
ncbi:hypothetical protein [Cohnella algarum]|uniref:hypothetical protein n=1 Tax=Cohnella algarum TaxID=2044859 RepID=UPI001F086C9A|nr:hypothetical protein [Cohnella algarum]